MADITYRDQGNLLHDFFLSKPIGDTLLNWQPEGLARTDDIEWHFEVRTTIGPCETDFFMSKNQYQLMRNFENQDNIARW